MTGHLTLWHWVLIINSFGSWGACTFKTFQRHIFSGPSTLNVEIALELELNGCFMCNGELFGAFFLGTWDLSSWLFQRTTLSLILYHFFKHSLLRLIIKAPLILFPRISIHWMQEQTRGIVIALSNWSNWVVTDLPCDLVTTWFRRKNTLSTMVNFQMPEFFVKNHLIEVTLTLRVHQLLWDLKLSWTVLDVGLVLRRCYWWTSRQSLYEVLFNFMIWFLVSESADFSYFFDSIRYVLLDVSKLIIELAVEIWPKR